MIRFTTNMGVFDVELNEAAAPKTCENFLSYVRSGFYNGTIFHRVISGFMIQGGGFEPGLKQKQTKAPIENEARGWGYAVFGKVVSGTDVIDAIARVRTASRSWYGDVPVEDVVMEKVEEI